MNAFLGQQGQTEASVEETKRKRAFAELLLRQGLSNAPIQHWTQGLARMAQAGIGGYFEGKAEREDKEGRQQATSAALAAMLGGSRPDTVSGSTGMEATASPASPSPTAPAAPSGSAAPASFSGGSQEFVSQMMPHAQRVSQQTGIDPRIVIAQAALESAWGRRAPGNNFFGIKSHGVPGGNTFATTEVVNGQPVRTRDSFRAYGSMGESADGYAQFLRQNPRYRPMLQAQGLDAQIQALGASGYATDPNYAAKIRQIASGIQVAPAAPAAPAATTTAPPPDSLDGGDGMEGLAAPDLAGTFNTMRMAAPGPMDPRARAFDQIAQAGMQPSQAVSSAPSVDDMMAGQQITQPVPEITVGGTPAPTQAPIPQDRPVQVATQAPMPQPRPNIEPPPQAQPAMAQAPVPMGMSERDRLMLLRDEQSLAPGEAQTLRAGLAGQMATPPQQSPSLVQMLMGGGSPSQAPAQPAPAQSQPTASAAAPVGTSAAPPAGGNARLAALLSAASNPRTPPALAAVLMGQIQRETTPATPIKMGAEDRLIDPRTGREVVAPSGNRPTDDERNYLNYEREERAAGRPVLSRFEWGQQRRRAQANSVNVNTTETGDAAFNTETAKKQAAMFDTLVQDGGTARQDAARIAELRRLGDRIGTGAGANLQAVAAQYGIKLGDNVSEIEAFQAIVNQLVPGQRPAGSGAMSDRDVQLFKNSLPSLINTPGGNAILFDTMQGIAEYRQSQAQIAAEAQTGAIPRAEAIRRLNALPDPLKAFRERMTSGGQPASAQPAAPGAPRRITSEADFNALPSGTEFIAPDGSRRRKP